MTIFFQIIPNQHTIRPKQQQTFPHKNLKNNQKKQKRAEDTNFVIPRDVEDEIGNSYAVGNLTTNFVIVSDVEDEIATSPPTLSFRGMSKTK